MLRTTRWAAALTQAQLQRVLADTAEQSCPAGASVCRKGEPADAWLGVVEGLVKVNAVSADGKSVTFTGMPEGSWFGEGSLLKTEPRRYDAVALRDSRIARVPRATFEWLLDSNIAFNRFLLEQLNERLGQFIGMVEHDRLLDTDARVARHLAELFNPILYPGYSRQLRISQEELGYLTGVSRQRVNQALQALDRLNLVRVGYAGIDVLDVEGLRRFGSTRPAQA
ncbi:MAG TPA: Crp/Fnr family transcriptional regulator [Burkholderiales bacterium]|jgi:CRP-like cAMP-binding protein|nr:Crp/Fnr family transcriptional regulator [Burkholderiales bacterium]